MSSDAEWKEANEKNATKNTSKIWVSGTFPPMLKASYNLKARNHYCQASYKHKHDAD